MSEILNTVLSVVLGLLPNDPLYAYINSISTTVINSRWIAWLNWLVPVHSLIYVFSLWLVAVLVYLGIRLVMAAFEAFKPT